MIVVDHGELIFLTLCLSLAAWYLYYGVECIINGMTFRRNPYTVPFTEAFTELTWVLPGGGRRKGNVIRDAIGWSEHGAMCGWRRSWSYKEIRDGNLYDECGADMLPGLTHFFLTHICLPFGLPTAVWFLTRIL